MRWGVGIGLSVVLCLALAQSASSGAFETPFAQTVCAAMDVAAESMDDPNNVFSGAGSTQECEKLCNKAVKQCRGYAKDSAGCLRRYVKEWNGYTNQNCDVIHDGDSEAKKACRQDAKETLQGQKQLIDGFLDLASEGCEDWGMVCIADCLPL